VRGPLRQPTENHPHVLIIVCRPPVLASTPEQQPTPRLIDQSIKDRTVGGSRRLTGYL